jgi:AraC-like DNA-binding protein
MSTSCLSISSRLPVRVQNGGLFVSRGVGIHPDRTIDSHELIFVRDGVLGIEEEGESFVVRPGESLVLWPHRRHRGTLPYAPDLSFYWVHFNIVEGLSGCNEDIRINQLSHVKRPDHLTMLFRRFLEDQESGELDQVTAGLLLMQMLVEAAREPADAVLSSIPLPLAAQADAVIRTRFADPLGSSMIASELACNANYLNIIYRRAFGRSLTDAIHAIRLRRARGMLTDGEGNIDEIARACGFADTGYFRRLFKRAEGMSPGSFRRLYARVHVNTA